MNNPFGNEKVVVVKDKPAEPIVIQNPIPQPMPYPAQKGGLKVKKWLFGVGLFGYAIGISSYNFDVIIGGLCILGGIMAILLGILNEGDK